LGGHFRLFANQGGTYPFRFEQYGTTTHSETMVSPTAEAKRQFVPI
jgi:hypothetical protein